MKRLITIITLAMLMVGFSFTVSFGGTKKIEPEQFKVYPINTIPYHIGPSYIHSNSESAAVNFYSVVKLPVGKVVKTLTVYYYGSDATNPPFVYVDLLRQKMGEDSQYVASGPASGNVTEITPVDIPVAPLYRKIKRGYKYWVIVYSQNRYSKVYGVKITYQ